MLSTYTLPAASLMTGRQPKTEAINARISDQGKKILYALQDYYGVSAASVLEMLLRDRQRELDIQIEPATKKRRT